MPKYKGYPDILNAMSQEKLDQLASILSMGEKCKKEHIMRLYSPGEQGYEQFQEFDRDGITFLGGGNAKNFLVTPSDGGPWFILKLALIISEASEKAEMRLRSGDMKDKFIELAVVKETTPIAYRRQLQVTDYCPAGDLLHYSKEPCDPEVRQNKAIAIYLDMSAILESIQSQECAFPDMKNANWLVQNDSALLIADSKSLLETKNGLIRPAYSVTHTAYMAPPQLKEKTGSPADKAHAYMLGKNLYEFLTNCPQIYLGKHREGKTFDFSLPVFQGDHGQALKELIIDSVKIDPSSRISVNDFHTRLQQIKLQKEAIAAASRIETSIAATQLFKETINDITVDELHNPEKPNKAI